MSLPSIVPHWTLRFFGRPTFERDDTPVLLTRPNTISFVAHVALAEGPLGRVELARFFWPGLDLERGLASLRITLSRARSILGDGLFEVDRHAVRLARDSPVWIDVRRFEQLLELAQSEGSSIELLEEAVSLYRGDLLLGTAPQSSSEVDAWRLILTERLRGRFHDALGRLADRYSESGRPAEAMAVARRLVGADPLNEAAHRRLLLLYARTGMPAAALRGYDECASILRAELGVAPEEETRQLRDAVERGDDFVPISARRIDALSPASGPGWQLAALPAPITDFIGRGADLALAEQRLDHPACRLLTLTGPGGAGKTELALAIARSRAARYRDGACFVSLAGVTDPDLVSSAIADALQLPPTCGAISARVIEHLRARRSLLVVDNLEHLLPGATTLAEILAAAPGIQIVATSRERLSLRGEHELVVEGLPCAEPAHPSGREPPSAAVALFVAAASRVDASFALTRENAPTIHHICKLVGGMPLGIDLAAARVRNVALDEIAAALERNIDAFTGPRDAPARHRCLRASYDWSYDLLASDEQAALRRLSIFRGGATSEAASAVAGASPALLSALGEKFLLRRDRGGRWTLHALIRQFAAEALAERPDEQREALASHAAHQIDHLADHAKTMTGPRRSAALSAMVAERDDLRAALRWATEQGRLDLVDLALDGFAAVEEALGHAQGARGVFTEIVAAARGAVGPSPLLGRALVLAGRFALESGAIPEAAAQIEEGLGLLLAADASADLGAAYLVAGRLALLQGNFEAARWILRASLVLSRPRRDRSATAVALRELGWVFLLVGDAVKAQRLLRGALARFQLLEDSRGIAACLGALGAARLFAGDLTGAEASCREGVRASRLAGDLPLRADLLAQLGSTLSLRGAVDEADAVLGEALRLSRALGYPVTEAAALHGQGLVALARGEPARAVDIFLASLRLRQNLNIRHGIAETHLALGRALATSDQMRACAHFDAALVAAMEAQAAPLVLQSLLELGIASHPARGAALRRALTLLLEHPAASRATRDQAAAALAAGGGSVPQQAGTGADLSAILEAMRAVLDD